MCLLDNPPVEREQRPLLALEAFWNPLQLRIQTHAQQRAHRLRSPLELVHRSAHCPLLKPLTRTHAVSPTSAAHPANPAPPPLPPHRSSRASAHTPAPPETSSSHATARLTAQTIPLPPGS